MNQKPAFGKIALIGSGETAAAGGQVYELLVQNQPLPLQVSVLETPAGFELNASRVAGRVGEYMAVRLQNYRPVVSVLPARRLGTDLSPNDPALLEPLLDSNLIFLGPGSPSYTIRQLRSSLAWQWVRARHACGAALALASAAAIAMGSLSLPVYEIYKVGEDPFWKTGLDLFRPFGLNLIILPHWNNNDGGAELDTRYCFMGAPRFNLLREMIPPQSVILGIDEQTAAVFDFENGTFQAAGKDALHILRDGHEETLLSGGVLPMETLGSFRLPGWEDLGLPEAARTKMEEHRLRRAVEQDARLVVPVEVQNLVMLRQQARENRNWGESDTLRARILALGWQVKDTPAGPVIEPLETGG